MRMNRACFAVVATLVGASFVSAPGSRLLAQKAPEFKSVLAGKKVGDNVVTTIKVKNMASAPLARLKIAETWFDKAGNIVAAGENTLVKPLGTGMVDTITIETPWTAKMNGNSWNFSHANGLVKPKRVKSLDEPAAKTVAKKK